MSWNAINEKLECRISPFAPRMYSTGSCIPQATRPAQPFADDKHETHRNYYRSLMIVVISRSATTISTPPLALLLLKWKNHRPNGLLIQLIKEEFINLSKIFDCCDWSWQNHEIPMCADSCCFVSHKILLIIKIPEQSCIWVGILCGTQDGN